MWIGGTSGGERSPSLRASSSRGTEGTARRRPGNHHAPPARTAGVGTVPIPSHGEGRRGEDEKEVLMSTLVTETRTTPHRDGAFGHARALSCRECGHEVDLGPFYACPECFGPLEVAYDFPAVTRADIEAGAAHILGIPRPSPAAVGATTSPNTKPSSPQ